MDSFSALQEAVRQADLVPPTAVEGQLVAPDLDVPAAGELVITPHGDGFLRLAVGGKGETGLSPFCQGQRFDFIGTLPDGRRVQMMGATGGHFCAPSPDTGLPEIQLRAWDHTTIGEVPSVAPDPCEVVFDLLNVRFSFGDRRGRSFTSNGSPWLLSPARAYDERSHALRLGLAEALPTAELRVEADVGCALDALWQTAHDSCALLSVCCASSVVAVRQRVADRRGTEAAVIRHVTRPRFPRGSAFVDGQALPNGGLAAFLGLALPGFAKRRRPLSMFMSWLMHSLEQTSVEQRLAGALLALELLCSSVVRHDLQWGDHKVQNCDVASKVGAISKRLIPLAHTSLPADLARSVRNPLFHEGRLNLPSCDAWELCKQLWSVSLVVFLWVVGYSGPYHDPSQGWQLVGMPQPTQCPS